MKKYLFAAALIMTVCRASAQATLEHVYGPSYGYAQVVLFSSNGEKIMTYDTTAVRLYNMNHTLWKTIPLPAVPGHRFSSVYLVSDNLFNTDNSVELVAVYFSIYSYPRYMSQLISETGSVLQSIDTTAGITLHYNEVDDNYKLFTYAMSSAVVSGAYFEYTNKVFSLPGTLPCGKCGTTGTERISGQVDAHIGVSDPSPNPSGGTTRIDYQLPISINDAQLVVYNVKGDIVKVQQLVPQAAFVLLDNSGFAPGVYTYLVKSGAMSSEVKKMMVK